MKELTFSNSAALLAANGFAPIPLGSNGQPLGPVYVLQTNWARFPVYAEAPVAVLTTVPAATNAHAPVQNAPDTWLAVVRVSVREELKTHVDEIVKRYTGTAKCPVRVAGGEALYVFKLAGDRFSTLATAFSHQPDSVRVESAASFVALNGEWVDGISLLDVFRSDLPPLALDHAQALIYELNRLLDERAPPASYFPPPVVPRPLLEPGQRLLYGNRRAMDALREHGFPPVPVRWGQHEAEKAGYSDANGRWHYTVPVDEHGVGISLRGFALIEFGGRYRAEVDEAVRSMGTCIVRSAAGDDCPVYLFRCSAGTDQPLYSPAAFLRVRRTGLAVLSGADSAGREFQWDRDILRVGVNELTTFEPHDGQRLQRVLEALPIADDSKVSKRRKSAA